MTSNTTGTPRKPSGSSSNSGGQSPHASPGTHKIAPSNNMFGVNMASGGGLKTLNSGWQVFTNGTTNSKRTASMSSVASLNETTSNEPNFRPAVAVSTWNAPRQPTSWDKGNPSIPNGDIGSPQKKDLVQIASGSNENHSPSHAYSLQQARQRQATAAQAAALSAPRIVSLGHEDERRLLDDGAERTSKGTSFSPQRFDGNATKAASPTRPNGFITPFATSSNPQTIYNAGTQVPYDGPQPGPNVDELALGVRGMAVEDDYGSNPSGTHYRPQHPQHVSAVPPVNGFNIPQIRPPLPMQPTRPAYGPYPQDYSSYYPANPPTRESFPMEYPYGYESYRNTGDPGANLYGSGAPPSATPSPGGLYPAQPIHPAHDMHHRNPSGLFYEYNGGPRTSGSQYFYTPHQPMVYHAPPAHAGLSNPQLASVPAGSLTENKKRELQNMQYTLQPQHQQLSHQQNLILASIRHSTPSPHSQPYPTSIEYTNQLPVLLGTNVLPPTPVYSHGVNNPHAMHIYPNLRQTRRLDGGDTAPLRSALLDEFRANKTRKWELRDIFGYIVEFSGDQHGSRFIQQKLETASSEEKQIVFDEIVPNNALQLIQDVFGNYVIQKLFEHGTQVHKSQLASTMEGHVLALSLQMYGCRVVQKAVECILPEQQTNFVKELDNHVLKCVKDANGNHVIQKLIERVSPDKLGFVNAFRGNVYELSTHPYGCRVLQRCFEHLTEEQNRPLLDELHKYTTNLMQDQFGNYVIQFVLEHGKPEDRFLFISKLRGQLLHMAKHKFASNVCEKALVMADAENRRLLIDEIMTPKQDGVNPIIAMMKDQFASMYLDGCGIQDAELYTIDYVLQRSLMVVEGDQKTELVNAIRPQLTTMRKYSSAYSKHLISIERLLEKSTIKLAEEGLSSTDGKI